MGRSLVTLSAVAAVAALAAGSARAALFLTFSTTRAAPGTVVTARTGGAGALANIPPGSPSLRVFLAPSDEADAITSPDDARLVFLGRLRVDEEGNGRLRFVVPDVPGGAYTTLTHCVPCAPFSAGHELLPTGPFSTSFVVLGSDSGGGVPVLPVALAAGGAGLLLVLGIGWLVRRRRLT